MVQAVIQTTVTGIQGTPLASPLSPTGNQALVWNGTAWAPAGPFMTLSGGTFTGPITLSGNATTALNPVSLQQLQAGYLPLTGGTITGSLTLTGNVNANAFVAGAANLNANGVSAPVTGLSGGNFALGFNNSVNPPAVGYAVNGGSSNWLVAGQQGGYQACTHVMFAQSFAFGVMAQLTNLFSFTIASSDRELKSNIVGAGDALRIVNAIDVHAVDYKHPAGDASQHWDYSLITDEVSPHLPEAVIPAPRSEGRVGYESLDPQRLCAVLWRSVQQLSQRVDGIVPSDPRVKANTANYAPGVSIVSQLQPITFQYNGLGGTPNDVSATPPMTRIGFDASAVNGVMPDAVTSMEMKLNPTDTTDTAVLGINASNLIYPLVNAVRQLISRVQALESNANITPPAAETA